MIYKKEYVALSNISKRRSKLIRILTFVPLPRSPRGGGGTEEYAYSLMDELRNDGGFEVSVVTSGVKDSEPNSGLLHSMRDRSTTCINSSIILQRPVPKLSSFFVLLKLIRLIQKSDLVHIHMPYPFIESYVSFLTNVTGKRLVVTYHMDAHLDSEKTTHHDICLRDKIIEKAYFLISSRSALKRASIICSNTRAYALDSPVLIKFMDKVHVIYQGINEHLFRCVDNERANQLRLNLLQDKYEFIVSFVGRLVPYKGISFLLDAISIINETTDLKIHFVIGGTGREKSRLVELSQRLGLRNVSFIGYVKDADLFNLYTASDIVVSPSISPLESTPISLLSALSCGTPVIGTSIGGTEETIPNDGKRAEIIAPKNAKEIALSISRLLQANNNNNNKYATFSLGEKKPLIKLRFWSNVATDYGNLFSRLFKGESLIHNDQIALG